MSRVTGVPVGWLPQRGQQIKVLTMLVEKCTFNKPYRYMIPYVVPVEWLGDGSKYSGATVLDPKVGYYTDPVTVLDFKSLYPSIIIAHNLCYTTLVDSEYVRANKDMVRDRDYVVTPTGEFFLTPAVKAGLLPLILRELLAAREIVKSEIRNETDPFMKNVLKSRELAFKVMANSVYGFTGTGSAGMLPCLPVSSSITGYGRDMLLKTKKLTEDKFGYGVLYGDTDSVMIDTKSKTISEASERGKEVAVCVTEVFDDPIALMFEKIYVPWVLLSKKRYVGGKYESASVHTPVIDAKGIETKRRDNCRLVTRVMEEIIDDLIFRKDPESAVARAKNAISKVLTNDVDISELIISKSISKEDYVAKQPHVELVKRMMKRGEQHPGLRTRVPYIIVNMGPKDNVCDCSEDPLYALQRGLEPSAYYYIEHQLRKPVTRLLTPILGSDDMVNKTVFKGSHMNKRRLFSRPKKRGGIVKFCKAMTECLVCHCLCDNVVCKHCLESGRARSNMAELKRRFSEIEEIDSIDEMVCKKCRKEDSVPASLDFCSTRECDIMYRRVKSCIDSKCILETHDKIFYYVHDQ
jgi:DNA polymerase delta subunit 1